MTTQRCPFLSARTRYIDHGSGIPCFLPYFFLQFFDLAIYIWWMDRWWYVSESTRFQFAGAVGRFHDPFWLLKRRNRDILIFESGCAVSSVAAYHYAPESGIVTLR
ncbi:hypothetical protein P152DRAFT_73069 [Eremomyces bilateralis CBS 781.70]|uniref:Uncharacterized protein n=1 Tax=Eremomyces bilateralis CBS 781.70 TaxID=1392243 RepID=A0A6G1FYW1_9PEZI|nr:uncharacterized protein P152DRAFT_73069 [Eremomyces bilateralis CBS 781.70]KAF1810974.1 hypothetical protein P152DRAFT_73069 [Eremomyces bilateralis CBS 781.70]